MCFVLARLANVVAVPCALFSHSFDTCMFDLKIGIGIRVLDSRQNLNPPLNKLSQRWLKETSPN